MGKRFSLAFFILTLTAAAAAAQEVEVNKYTIAARIDTAANQMDVRAQLLLVNLSQSPKQKLYLRLTKLAKVSGAAAGGAPAQLEIIEDRRVATLNQIIITPQTQIAAGAQIAVEINYRIEVSEVTPLASIYPGEVLMLPEGIWVPMPSTPFALYGATTAPFTLTVTAPEGLRVASAGALKTDRSAQTVTFEQTLNSLPLIVAGRFDSPVSGEHGGIKIEVYIQPGLSVGEANGAAGREQAARIIEEAGHQVEFFTKTLGPPPPGCTFRVISSVRAGNIAIPGALVLNEQIFRMDVLDATTVELLADAIARLWIDGRLRVRGQEARTATLDRPAQKGQSAALLRDSLPRYLAALYFEDRYGSQAGREVFSRMRWVYTPVAQSGRDAELAVQTPLLPNYSAGAFAKGPLVLRLIAETIGRDKFLAALRQLLTGQQTTIITNSDFRAALAKAGGPIADKLFQQWVETIIEPDIVIGIPQQAGRPGLQSVNLRNLGTGEVTVTVVATTESGKRITTTAIVPSEDLTSIEIPTGEKIASIEVDPEKLIIQTNYDNDAKPVRISPQTLFNESIVHFNKGEYAQAEAKLKEALRSQPNNSLLHAWLARAQAAQNKYDEAASEAAAALRINPPLAPALAWAHITLGQIALSRNQAAEAVAHLRRAVAEAVEVPAQFAAREALIRAERAANKLPPVDESVRAFIAQLDALIKQPSSEKLLALINKSTLKRFAQGLALTPPQAWSTEILRADYTDANRVAVDVAIKAHVGGRDQSGTALFILYRADSNWILEDIRLFNVK
jgi:tetratricopeptide (TPR) repeat protein